MERQKLQELLYCAGVSPRYLGHGYFIEAVLLAAEEPRRLQKIQAQIYLPIALRHGVSRPSVERNLRTLRNVLMGRGGAQLLRELSGCSCWPGKAPYPKELIALFACHLTWLP